MRRFKTASAILVCLFVSNSKAQMSAQAAHTNDLAEAVTLPFPVPEVSTARELELAPLLDLHNGGIAVGAAQGDGETQGALVGGSLLPLNGVGYSASKSETNRWGSGILVSMIVNSAAVVAETFPGTLLKIGGIAQQFGGPYRPHKSHQNGLDADIQFVGTVKYESVLDENGAVTAKFDLEKNWNYWRLITSQRLEVTETQGKKEIVKEVSAVSMILVDPKIKAHLCQLMKEQGGLKDELDAEVMKRLRPTEGHDDHFHVRLRCSPHYANCIQSRDGFRTDGCEAFGS